MPLKWLKAVFKRAAPAQKRENAMSAFKYVVLGGGNSSGYAAKAFVEQGLQPGELCIITDEAAVAYERPALSKAYLFPEGAARLPGFHTCVGGGGERQAPEWYQEKGITYKTGAKVTAVDVAAKTLKLADGGSIGYDKLIVATGARVVRLEEFKTPGAELGGIHYLRNVADADALVAAIQQAKAAGNTAVVVGGGYIGMECAAGLRMNGLDVTMVFPEDRLMMRLFTPELAAFYERFYTDKGIQVVRGSLASAFEGTDGKVSKVMLKDGRSLEADLVVVGVGARPNSELFQGQLQLDKGGIVVDGAMRTSNPDVYAIGDVAAFPLLRDGGALVRQEHVTHCRSSAAQAVASILGKQPAAYDYLPFFYSRVFSLSWQFYGTSEGSVVHWGDQAASPAKFGAYWVKEGKVVGAFIEGGSPEEQAAIKKLAVAQPAAPEEAELAQQGAGFALAAKL